jgi:plastocyanin
MERGIKITIIAFVSILLLGGIIYLIYNNQSSSYSNNQNNINTGVNNLTNNQNNINTGVNNLTNNQNNTIVPTTEISKTYDITIKSFTFNPAVITIKKGDSIKWTNQDDISHSIIANSGLFRSENFDKGQSFTFTFNNSGESLYHCGLHPSMTGKIITQ